MSAPVIVSGTVLPDGRLELSEKLPLPPGPVQVTVQPAPLNIIEFAERIRADQMARGHVPRTREEVDAELNAMRDEAEEEIRALEAIHEASEAARNVRRASEDAP